MSCHRSINHNAPTNQDTTVFIATNLTPAEAHFLGEIQALFCDPALAEKRRLVMEGTGVIWRDEQDRAAYVVGLDHLQRYFYGRFIEGFNKAIPGPSDIKEKGT